MNKKEKAIILQQYKNDYFNFKNGFEYKEDSVRSLKNILNQLNLKIERIKIENEVNIENWSNKAKIYFKILFENLEFKNFIIDVESIESGVVEDFIEYELNNEDKKCNKNCFKNLLENMN